MNLLNTITHKLEQINHDELLKTMEYHNLKAGNRTLQKFLDTDDIYLWLKNGSFDMKYNSEQFLQHLLKALSLPSECNDELLQCNCRLDALRAMRNTSYLFIDTHFKRKGQTVLSLAFMEGRRHIRIDKELLVFKSENEVLKTIGNIVKKHYLESEGKLPLWGEIFTYLYYHTTGDKYIFNTDGTLSQNHSEISESRAELRLGNQIIGGMRNE